MQHQEYKMLPIKGAHSPSTGDHHQNCQSALKDYASQLKASALLLNCIARLIELYEIPGAMEEAVTTLESIATFYSENTDQINKHH